MAREEILEIRFDEHYNMYRSPPILFFGHCKLYNRLEQRANLGIRIHSVIASMKLLILGFQFC